MIVRCILLRAGVKVRVVVGVVVVVVVVSPRPPAEIFISFFWMRPAKFLKRREREAVVIAVLGMFKLQGRRLIT